MAVRVVGGGLFVGLQERKAEADWLIYDYGFLQVRQQER